jgi:hypothetical protein
VCMWVYVFCRCVFVFMSERERERNVKMGHRDRERPSKFRRDFLKSETKCGHIRAMCVGRHSVGHISRVLPHFLVGWYKKSY